MEATLDYAVAHLPQIIRRVKDGEEVLLRDGAMAVAKIVPLPAACSLPRPKVGFTTSAPVTWNSATFAALDEAGMKDLGML